MPFFPEIFWTMKFYRPVKNTDSTSFPIKGDNVGVALCADGNLFANYDFGFDFGSICRVNPQRKSAQYFCAEDSKSKMSTVNYRNISSNDILIICTITIPFDSYIGGQRLETFEYGRKVLDSQKHCDFVIKVKKKSFNVHKCVLSTHWPHFVTLLESGMAEANSGTLTIEDQMPNVIEAMIYYIYTGTSNVTDINLALELISVADKYDLPHLKMKSLQFVIAKMNKYCVIKALFKAKLHGLDDLLEVCIKCLKEDTTVINDLPNYDLLAQSDDGLKLLALCFDNVRGIKRKLEELDDQD